MITATMEKTTYKAKTYQYITDPSKVKGAVEAFLAGAVKEAAKYGHPVAIGFDTETTGLDPLVDKIRLLQLSGGDQHIIIDAFYCPAECLEPLFDILRDPKIVKVIQNAKFDFKFVLYQYGVLMVNLFCTYLASQILSCGFPHRHGLSAIAERTIGMLLDKAEQRSDWSVLQLTAEQLDYAAADSQVLTAIYREQRKQLANYNLSKVAKLEFDVCRVAAWIELRGFYLNRQKWMLLNEVKKARREEIQIHLTDSLDKGGYPRELNLNSGHQIKEVLAAVGIETSSASYNVLRGLVGQHEMIEKILEHRDAEKAYKQTVKSKGNDSPEAELFKRGLDRMSESLSVYLSQFLPLVRIDLESNPQVLEALHKIGEETEEPRLINLTDTNANQSLKKIRDIPLIAELLEYREFAKADDTYGETFTRWISPVTDRIHCNFKQLEAQTGRMACSDPNLQNIPHTVEYRSCFEIQEGYDGEEYVMVTLDYSQIEPRITAEVAHDAAFDAIFFSKTDLYCSFGEFLFERPVLKGTVDRSVSKALILGAFYGKGPKAMAEDIEKNGVPCDFERGKALMKLIRERLPATWSHMKRAGRSCLDTGISKTLMGRIRRVNRDGLTKEIIDLYDRLWHFPQEEQEKYRKEYEVQFKKISGIINQGKNTPIQGTSADITKLACVKIFEEYYGTGVYLVNVIHDEVVLEVPKRIAEEVKARVTELMIEAAEVWIKRIPIKAEGVIANCWAKG